MVLSLWCKVGGIQKKKQPAIIALLRGKNAVALALLSHQVVGDPMRLSVFRHR